MFSLELEGEDTLGQKVDSIDNIMAPSLKWPPKSNATRYDVYRKVIRKGKI